MLQVLNQIAFCFFFMRKYYALQFVGVARHDLLAGVGLVHVGAGGEGGSEEKNQNGDPPLTGDRCLLMVEN